MPLPEVSGPQLSRRAPIFFTMGATLSSFNHLTERPALTRLIALLSVKKGAYEALLVEVKHDRGPAI